MGAAIRRSVAKVTKRKSGTTARFQCWDVYRLWDDGKVTIDHRVEDEEWGGIEEWRAITDSENYPQGFFKPGFSREMNRASATREEPL